MTWPNIVAHVISLHLVDLAKQKTGRRLVIITDKRRCNIGRRLYRQNKQDSYKKIILFIENSV